MNVRAVAARVIFQVVDQGQSLSSALPLAQAKIAPRDGGLLQEICYGVLRWLPRLESIAQTLMAKPLKGKQRVCHHLILVGLYQLSYMRVPPHAAVAETVDATNTLKQPQLRGLVNAILRQYQRDKEQLDVASTSHVAGKFGHPSWLVKQLQHAYPEQWQDILNQNNEKAPMWLRVNRQHQSRAQYQALLDAQAIASEIHPDAPDALRLIAACDVRQLPEFEHGWVSVQDGAAQLAVEYLAPRAGEMILDCCAAPGGKTCHMLEREPSLKVVAMDLEPTRLERVAENLSRLSLSATLICGDARYPASWWQGAQFDRILLDAPCSATGVIRRHPDIKWLRREADIEQLVQVQAEILDAMWDLLKTGGRLVYATCSILPAENSEQIKKFLARTPNAKLITGEIGQPGMQLLPGQENMDGFYYAALTKC